MKSLGPCFPFYHDDYLGGTSAFNDRQHGAYLLLLIEQWRTGYLPADNTILMSLARTKMRATDYRWKAVIEKFEPCGEGIIRNARMHAIRCERIDHIEKQRRNANARWAKDGDATAMPPHMPPHMPNGMPNACPPSPSPSPEKIERESSAPLSPFMQMVRDIQTARQDWTLNAVHVAAELNACHDKSKLPEIVRQFTADAANGDKPRNPIGMLRGYVTRANGPEAAAGSKRGRASPAQRKMAIEALMRPLKDNAYRTPQQDAELVRLRKELEDVNRVIAKG